MPRRKPTAPPVPKVFISSTLEDLKPYRAAAGRAAIEAGFFPVLSENLPAGSHEPPLDTCLQKVSECDLLVVLAGHRHGWTPSKNNRAHKSITRMECERAESDGHEVLAFLVDPKYDGLNGWKEDERLAEAARQRKYTKQLEQEVDRNIEKLEEFKQWLSGGKHWRKEFTTAEDLKSKVLHALHTWRERHPEFQAVSPPVPGTAPDLNGYFEYLRDSTGYIEIRGLRVSSGEANRIPIEDLYIPLTTAAEPEDGGRGKRRTEGELSERMGEPVPLQRALRHKRLVIVGDPGAGKTTFIHRIVFALAQTHLGTAPKAAEERLGLGERPFPIWIRIAALAEHIRPRKQDHTRPRPATDESHEWLPDYLAAQGANWGLDADFFREKLNAESEPAIALLDGLDEAPGRVERESAARLFEDATRAYKKCRFVVTTRPRAYEGDAAAHQRELSEALRGSAEIRRMGRNPVMLTAFAVLYWNDKRLPEQRADLYESILTWLSRRRQKRTGREPAERCLDLLAELALAMQDHPDGRQVGVEKGWAAGVIAPQFRETPEGQRRQRAERFLDEEEVDSGIIVNRGEELQFWHSTFREYLAARAIGGLEDAEQRALLLREERLHSPEWREVMLLFGGVLRLKQGVKKVDALVSAMLERVGEGAGLADQARYAGLLGAMVRDLSPFGYEPADQRYRRTLDKVLGIFEPAGSAIDMQTRLEAADALGLAGDPRLAENNWVRIPAGKFLMGAQKDDPNGPGYDSEGWVGGEFNEAPVHEVELDAFEIGRYPVTVAEFRQFLENGGYDEERWWNAGGFGYFRVPGNWDEQLQHPASGRGERV